MVFQRISIIGVGLIGGSVGLACRSISTALQITGYSLNTDELRRAHQRGAIDVLAQTPADAVKDAELVILCTPVGQFKNVMGSIADALPSGAIVTDVGSTKRSIVQHANQTLTGKNRFVGSHPMAGGEKPGIDHARVDLLTNALCILTPDSTTDADALSKVDNFWQSLKMRTVRMTPERHDELTALASHLPHAIAAALVRTQTTDSLGIGGRGFQDTTRIAAADPVLWRDILLDNRDNLKSAVGRIQCEINDLLQILDSGDGHALQQWLAVHPITATPASPPGNQKS